MADPIHIDEVPNYIGYDFQSENAEDIGDGDAQGCENDPAEVKGPFGLYGIGWQYFYICLVGHQNLLSGIPDHVTAHFTPAHSPRAERVGTR
jgi:hypothetical protein